jgi:hypothetical protein
MLQDLWIKPVWAEVDPPKNQTPIFVDAPLQRFRAP